MVDPSTRPKDGLRRSTTDVKVAGVCGGVAERWNVDPVLVRVATVLLALSGGVGLVLYVAGWLLVPARGQELSIMQTSFPQTRRWSRELWIVVTVVAGLLTFSLFGAFTPFGFPPAIVLAVVWYFGYYRGHRRWRRPSQPPSALQAPTPPFSYPGPATPFTEAARACEQRVAEYERTTGGASGSIDPAPPVANPPAFLSSATPPAQPTPTWSAREDDTVAAQAVFLAHPDPVGLYAEPMPPTSREVRLARGWSLPARRLRLAALLVLGLTLAGLAGAGSVGVTVPVVAYLAAALLVAGLTLTASAWTGRARGILPVAALLLVGTLVALATPVTGSDLSAVGTKSTLIYQSQTQLPATDTRKAGDLTVDLSALRVTQPGTYRVDLDLGHLVVVLPKNANVAVNWTVDAGAMADSDGSHSEGTRLSGTLAGAATRVGAHTLTVVAHVRLGQLEVRQ